MRRHRPVPQRHRRRDVPQLPRDRRRAALHARPGADAAGDAARRHRPRRVALHRGPRRPGPVPVVQGLLHRLPGGRRHGHLQGGVPAPALPGPDQAAVALLAGVAAAHRGARRATSRARSTPLLRGPVGKAGSRGSVGSPRAGRSPPSRSRRALRSALRGRRTGHDTGDPRAALRRQLHPCLPPRGRGCLGRVLADAGIPCTPAGRSVLRSDLGQHRPAVHRPPGHGPHGGASGPWSAPRPADRRGRTQLRRGAEP